MARQADLRARPSSFPSPTSLAPSSRQTSTSGQLSAALNLSAALHLQLGRQPLDVAVKSGHQQRAGNGSRKRPPDAQNRVTTARHGPDRTQHPPTNGTAHHGPYIRNPVNRHHSANHHLLSSLPFVTHQLNARLPYQRRSKSPPMPQQGAGSQYWQAFTSAGPKQS